MRYDKRITFVREIEGGFNPSTGNHEEGELIKTTLPCNISSLGVDRSAQLFGEIDTSMIVVRLQRIHKDTFDHALIDDKKYHVKRHIPHDYESVFYMEGAP